MVVVDGALGQQESLALPQRSIHRLQPVLSPTYATHQAVMLTLNAVARIAIFALSSLLDEDELFGVVAATASNIKDMVEGPLLKVW